VTDQFWYNMQPDTKEDLLQKQIIKAAQQLYQVHGIEKVTMDDVAREIGKSRSSLYYYYKNKEEILAAAIDTETAEAVKELNQAVDRVHTLDEKIKVYFITRLKISQKRSVLHELIDSSKSPGEVSAYIKEKHKKHVQFRQIEIPLFKNMLNIGIEKGEIRPMDQKEQEALIFVLLSAIQGFKKELVIKNNFNTITSGIDMLIHLTMQGFKK
jgi:AcrR family transcriptional regulator